MLTKIKLLLGAMMLVWSGFVVSATVTFRPGEIWPDNDGQSIQAHGGGVIQVGDTFYWFGEDRARDNPENLRCISCYSSKDLAHWRHCGQVLKRAVPVMERPKVFYNATTKKFVMYVHLDGPVPGLEGDYNVASIGVAVCDTVDGQYQFLKSFRPLGHESRDIGQFIDDDGTAYLLSEDRPNGFHIYKLSDDYLSIAKDVCMVPEHLEGLGLVHYDGLYYVVGSHLTGWGPNPNVYGTAKSLAGPWSAFRNIAPPETKTYGSQSSYLLKIKGTKATTVIFMADIWKPQTQWDSRYLWMPLKIGGGKMWLPQPRPWTLDLETGEAVMEPAGSADAESNEDSSDLAVAGDAAAGLNTSDIGSPAMSGSASYANGVWTVAGGGSDIWLAGDQFGFLTNSLNGDGAVIARVTGQTDTDPWALAGIMIRNDISDQSPEVSLLLTPESGITFRCRSVAGGPTSQVFQTGVASPQWIRLSRSGNTFTADYSADGIHWTQLGEPQTVAMSRKVLAGLAVSAHNNALLSTGTFTDFLIVPGPQAGVPADLYNHWDNQHAFVWETTWPLPQLNVAANAPTPVMGWNSWQVVGDTPGPSEYLITNTANALVADGLAAAGYKTVTIDCTWIASGRGYRDTNGDLIVDTNCWPNGMKAVADYVHSMGLRMGGYSDIGAIGYGNPPHVQVGMYPNYQQDADQFAA